MSDPVNRRGFLASLLAAPVAAVAADPKRFVAPPAHAMGNRVEVGKEWEPMHFAPVSHHQHIIAGVATESVAAGQLVRVVNVVIHS